MRIHDRHTAPAPPPEMSVPREAPCAPPAPDTVILGEAPSSRRSPDRSVQEAPGAEKIPQEREARNLGSGGSFFSSALAAVTGPLGRALGHAAASVVYNSRCYARLLKNRLDTLRGKVDIARSERTDTVEDLTAKDLKAVDRTGNVRRKYDGYDSSRDICAVYAKEGAPTDTFYDFQVEMSHLRGGAEEGMLSTYLCLDWDGEGGTSEPPFALDCPQMSRWKAAVRIEGHRQSAIVDHQGGVIEQLEDGAALDYRYSTVKFRIDKFALCAMGWKRGTPLKLQVITARQGERDVADMVEARTDAEGGRERQEKLFRWEGKTIYNVITDRFHDGDTTNNAGVDRTGPEKFHGGDWQGIIDKMDYLKDLGTDVIWISCPYENDRDFFGMDGYHGYWPHDFTRAEPSFGTKEKLRELVEKAHENGMKVLLDVVVNHTGYNHPFVSDEEHRDWFNRDGNLGVLGFMPYQAEHQALAGLPDLNHDNPEVREYVIDTHRKWVDETGVDGFRIDAIRHVPQSFLEEFDREMQSRRENFFTVGECFWPGVNFDSRYQRESIDSTFDFPVALELRSALKDRESAGKIDFSGFFEDFRKAFKDYFLSSGTSTMEDVMDVLDKDGFYENPNKICTIIDNHDMDRFMTLAGGNKRTLSFALGFIYGIRGMPTIYYGTEAGLEGREGPENRKDMDFGANRDIAETLGKLTRARKSSLALWTGGQVRLYADDDSCALARVRPDEEVICVYNNSKRKKRMTIPLEGSKIPDGARLEDMLSDYGAAKRKGRLSVEVPPGGYRFLQWKKP